MLTLTYPSAGFKADFDAAIGNRIEFMVIINNPKTADAISRTIERLRGNLPNDRFLTSIQDKFRLNDFYPCLADAWINHRYTIGSLRRENHFEVLFEAK